MRVFLTRLYQAAGILSASLIAAICLLVSAQIILNGLGRLFPGTFPTTIPSYADFSGFMLAGSTFLAMAYTLRSGGHIRVNLIVQRLPASFMLAAEALSLTLALLFTGIALWFSAALVQESLHYGDVSTGIIPVPLWIPQTPMVVGLGLLLIALAHTLFDLVQTRSSVLTTADEV